MKKIIIHGVNGKMGQVLVSTAEENGCEIVAGIDVTKKENSFPVFDSLEHCSVEADAVIDFSVAQALPKLLADAVNKNIPVVVCTTGLIEDTMNLLNQTAKKIPIFKSANMSIGINLLLSVLRKSARILDESGFDIEIVEKHHSQKIDAPSGTALMIANAVNSVLVEPYPFKYDRTPDREKRSKKEIGMHSVRGGTIVGEHEVIFAGKDEVIEFKHTASSREVFAAGAFSAAKFIIGKEPRIYDMQHYVEKSF